VDKHCVTNGHVTHQSDIDLLKATFAADHDGGESAGWAIHNHAGPALIAARDARVPSALALCIRSATVIANSTTVNKRRFPVMGSIMVQTTDIFGADRCHRPLRPAYQRAFLAQVPNGPL
jgi:hypothetical protein